MKELDLEKLKQGRLILFGTGKMARVLWAYLKERGAVSGFFVCLDNDCGKQGKTFEGLEIQSPERLPEIWRPGDRILISTVYYMDIVNQIKTIMPEIPEEAMLAGISIKIPYEDDPEEQTCADLDFSDIRGLLADDASRTLLDFVLKVRGKGISLYSFDEIADVSRNMWYWENVPLTFGERSAVIDCGAYTGDSILQICTALQGHVHRYYAMEPDEGSRKALLETEERLLGEKGRALAAGACRPDFFHNIWKGAWNRSGTLDFIHYDLASSSSFTENQNMDQATAQGMSVDVMRIDDLDLSEFDDIRIKMDIEGSEMNALRGAAELIRTKAPKLAVCAYHRYRDLIHIPMLIHELNPAYKIYLRGGIHYAYYAQL